MIALGCVLVVKLPPGDRIKAFEKLDFVTFMLLAPGMALLCGVLSLGRMSGGSAPARLRWRWC